MQSVFDLVRIVQRYEGAFNANQNSFNATKAHVTVRILDAATSV
jgi:hypothetical protein